jgi:Uma2 family endonuclease
MIALKTKAEPFVVLYGIDWKQYEAILAALEGHHLRHSYDRGTLEMKSLLAGVSWEAYQAFLDALGDHSIRHSYDRGILELMSPRKDHDWVKKLIGRFIETLSLELNIPIQSIGSTTLGKQLVERGFEPDESYYVTNEPVVRDKKTYDPRRDPPPDLIVEVDVTYSSVKRMPLFASLGVPEVWRHDGQSLAFYRLGKRGKYRKINRSRELPIVTPRDISKFLNRAGSIDETSLVRSFLDWVRKQADR